MTSSRCRSWRPSARSATRSAGTTSSSCTSRWCPTSAPSGELKTKPTQHSVARAAQHRHPARRHRLPLRPARSRRRQAQDLADVRRRRGGGDRRPDAPSHLRHPQGAARRGPGRLRGAQARAALPRRRLDRAGTTCCSRVHQPDARVDGSPLVGKYIDLPDAYLSVTEALRAGGFANNARVDISWVASDDCETAAGAARSARRRRRRSHPRRLRRSAASRARSARSATPARTRSRARPLPGAAVHRHRVRPQPRRARRRQLHGVRPGRPHPVIATMAEQHDIVVGERRHGRHHAPGPLPGQAGARAHRSASVYGATQVYERHRHRYEVNNAYRDELEKAGLRLSGTSPTAALVEFVETRRDAAPLPGRPPRPTPS